MSLENLPVVPGANLLGHAHLFRRDRLAFLRAAKDAGAVARVRFLARWVVFVSCPDGAHEILVERAKSFEKAPVTRVVLHDLVGDGLFTSEGELWRRQRRLMSPLFHGSQLAAYAGAMNRVAARAVDRLRDGQHIDLAREMTRITMGVVAATLFGADTHEEADDGLGEAMTVALQWVDKSLVSNFVDVQIMLVEGMEASRRWMPSVLTEPHRRLEQALRAPVLLPGRRDAELEAAVRTLDARMQAMIGQRRLHPEQRADLLAKLLLARDPEGGHGEAMSDRQLRDESITLFLAGHETTANALAWAFYLLARNPEALARVQAEANAFGSDGPTTYSPSQLEYTTRVFKETLRLYPPLVVLARRSLEAFELRGRTYGPRTLVFVNPYGIHMSEAVWEDPERFDPDRFLPQRESSRHKAAWIPFGVGPRTCIGGQFALMEGPIVAATLLRKARFEIDPGLRIEADACATLRPKGGVPAIVRQIH
jgi:cytochrome P450